nr:hypothetical protein [Xanthomonas populi]
MLQVLLTQPQLFQHYVAVDPSPGWCDGFLVQQARRLVDHEQAGSADPQPSKRRLTLMAGEGAPVARDATPDRPGRPRADPHAAQSLVTLLSSLPVPVPYPASPPSTTCYLASAMVKRWAHHSRQRYGTQRRVEDARSSKRSKIHRSRNPQSRCCRSQRARMQRRQLGAGAQSSRVSLRSAASSAASIMSPCDSSLSARA